MIRLGRHSWGKRSTLTQWLWIHIQAVEYDDMCEPDKTWSCKFQAPPSMAILDPGSHTRSLESRFQSLTGSTTIWVQDTDVCNQSGERCWQPNQPVVMDMCGNLSNFLGSADPKELWHALWRLRRHEDLSLASKLLRISHKADGFVIVSSLVDGSGYWNQPSWGPMFSIIFPSSLDGECVLCHWFSCLIQQK